MSENPTMNDIYLMNSLSCVGIQKAMNVENGLYSAESVEKFVCPECPREEKEESEMEVHLCKDHLSYFPYGCGHCIMAGRKNWFPTEATLEYHSRRKHFGLDIEIREVMEENKDIRLLDLLKRSKRPTGLFRNQNTTNESPVLVKDDSVEILSETQLKNVTQLTTPKKVIQNVTTPKKSASKRKRSVTNSATKSPKLKKHRKSTPSPVGQSKMTLFLEQAMKLSKEREPEIIIDSADNPIVCDDVSPDIGEKRSSAVAASIRIQESPDKEHNVRNVSDKAIVETTIPNDNKDMMKCRLCDVDVPIDDGKLSMMNLRTHVIGHHLKKPFFHCSDCKFEWHSVKKVSKHVKKNHSNASVKKRDVEMGDEVNGVMIDCFGSDINKHYRCKVCNKGGSHKVYGINRQYHASKKHNQTVEQCFGSESQVGDADVSRSDIRSRKPDFSNKREVIKCRLCGRNVPIGSGKCSMANLRLHVIGHHLKKPFFHCSDCKFEYFRKDKMMDHIKKNHLGASIKKRDVEMGDEVNGVMMECFGSDINKQYRCKVCNKGGPLQVYGINRQYHASKHNKTVQQCFASESPVDSDSRPTSRSESGSSFVAESHNTEGVAPNGPIDDSFDDLSLQLSDVSTQSSQNASCNMTKICRECDCDVSVDFEQWHVFDNHMNEHIKLPSMCLHLQCNYHSVNIEDLYRHIAIAHSLDNLPISAKTNFTVENSIGELCEKLVVLND